MLPIDFEGTNSEFHKPEGPNKEDMEAINAGRPIMVKVCMKGMVPIAVYTFDENYNANV